MWTADFFANYLLFTGPATHSRCQASQLIWILGTWPVRSVDRQKLERKLENRETGITHAEYQSINQ